MPSIDQSRELLLDELGPNPDLTLIRTEGNIGDELIWAGTRCLLADRVYREIGIEQVSSSSGELAVIVGSGAWGRVYNQFMPELLAIAELRFSRVIVFPSTFEVSEDRVRAALTGSRATFIAREEESFRQISGLCRAKLALDGAFYYDYDRFDELDPSGELNAFRTDEERLGLLPLPEDNQDISVTAESLDDWLETIARHKTVNTDRAHVMIAAALMGRRVNYAPSCYFKVDALAQSLLGDRDVHRLALPSNGQLDPSSVNGLREQLPTESRKPTSPRVSLMITGRDNVESIEEAVTSSLPADDQVRVIVHDRNSRPRARRVLEHLAADQPAIELRCSDRDPGAPETLRLAAAEAESEFLLVLDYGMRLGDGALEHMIAVLDENPSVQAVAPAVIDADGKVQHAGGWTSVGSETVSIDFTARDKSVTQLDPSTAPTGWVPSFGTLFRRSALELVPFAEIDDELVQSADWCLRIAQLSPDALRVCRAATVVSERSPTTETQPMFVSRRFAASALPAYARLLERSGLILSDRLTELVPELKNPRGELDVASARLLLTLVSARGAEWTLMQWMNGGLEPIFAGAVAGSAESIKRERDQLEWLVQRNESLIGIENGAWWKLRNRLNPLRRVVLRLRRSGGGKGESAQ